MSELRERVTTAIRKGHSITLSPKRVLALLDLEEADALTSELRHGGWMVDFLDVSDSPDKPRVKCCLRPRYSGDGYEEIGGEGPTALAALRVASSHRPYC